MLLMVLELGGVMILIMPLLQYQTSLKDVVDMKYTTRRKQKDGSYKTYFNAPKDALKAGIVGNQVFTDGRTARYEIPRLIERVELFRKGGIAAVVLNKENSIRQAISHYLVTDYYAKSLKDSTKARFETAYKFLSKDLGDTRIKDINAKDLNKSYQQWVKTNQSGVCNTRVLALTYLFDYLVLHGLLPFNFAKAIVRTTITTEKIKFDWTKELAAKLITECLSVFKSSSMGLLLLIIYETAQNPKDVQRLLWDDIDLDNNCVLFPRRGLTLPLQASTIHLLKQQKIMWGFQKYVLPYHRISDNSYVPMDSSVLSSHWGQVKERLGITERLDLRQLRVLAAKEMVSLGVEPHYLANILSIQPSAVNKYYKLEETKNKEILAKRFANVEEGSKVSLREQ